ncbi:MAG: hypothetical protein R3258_04750 [Acidimicrobiia bacterium]|nr:hypothetical protein [Acidimicrobiia bacterium]
MTARPVTLGGSDDRLRVIKGRRLRRPSVAPWMIMVAVGVLAFLGLGFARTSLDRSAFEIAELTEAIEQAEKANQLLRLEIARLENPSRIAPLAEQLGMILPTDRNQLLVDLPSDQGFVARLDSGGGNQ